MKHSNTIRLMRRYRHSMQRSRRSMWRRLRLGQQRLRSGGVTGDIGMEFPAVSAIAELV